MSNKITQEELDGLKKELEYLSTVKMREVAQLIKHTASYGDLKENASYHDAKDKQAFLHGKILELRARIRNSKVVKHEESDKIQLGSKVILEIQGDKESIQITGSGQSDPLEGKISCDSPLGEELMNRRVGEMVEVKTETNTIQYKILEIK